jgi:uncharacterized protein with PIN domain
MKSMQEVIRDENTIFWMRVDPKVAQQARALLQRGKPEPSKFASRKCYVCGKRFALDETERVYSAKYHKMIRVCDECYKHY